MSGASMIGGAGLMGSIEPCPPPVEWGADVTPVRAFILQLLQRLMGKVLEKSRARSALATLVTAPDSSPSVDVVSALTDDFMKIVGGPAVPMDSGFRAALTKLAVEDTVDSEASVYWRSALALQPIYPPDHPIDRECVGLHLLAAYFDVKLSENPRCTAALAEALDPAPAVPLVWRVSTPANGTGSPMGPDGTSELPSYSATHEAVLDVLLPPDAVFRAARAGHLFAALDSFPHVEGADAAGGAGGAGAGGDVGAGRRNGGDGVKLRVGVAPPGGATGRDGQGGGGNASTHAGFAATHQAASAAVAAGNTVAANAAAATAAVAPAAGAAAVTPAGRPATITSEVDAEPDGEYRTLGVEELLATYTMRDLNVWLKRHHGRTERNKRAVAEAIVALRDQPLG